MELFDYGVDTSTTDFKGRTALHVGAQGYSPGVLRLLLEKGAEIAAGDGEGMTTLHFAYQKGVERAVDCLIEKGANTEADSIYGLIPEMLYSLSAYSQAMTKLGRLSDDISVPDVLSANHVLSKQLHSSYLRRKRCDTL